MKVSSFGCCLFALILLHSSITGQEEDRLAQIMKRFPEADLDKDGRLPPTEVEAYKAKMKSQRNEIRSQNEWRRFAQPQTNRCEPDSVTQGPQEL